MHELISKQPKSRTNYIDVSIGNNLKNRRIMLGLSQQDLADAVDLSMQQIQKYERGINRISSSKLFKFAKLLSTPIIEFFTGIDTDESIIPAANEENFLLKNSNITEYQLLSFIKAFNSIKDPNICQKIIELTRSLSSMPLASDNQ